MTFHLPPANLTNSITNGIHASFLLTYSIIAAYYYLRKDERFNLTILMYFFLAFLLKSLGVFVHYYDTTSSLSIKVAWLTIFFFSFFFLALILKISLLSTQDVARRQKHLFIFLILINLFCVSCAAFLLLSSSNESFQFFYFIAFAALLTYTSSSFFLSGYVRAGFILNVLSQVTWMVLRFTVPFCPFHTLNKNCTYDNDIYHFLLILSGSLVFIGILKGNLLPKGKGNAFEDKF